MSVSANPESVALSAFRKPPLRLNCAQSVALAHLVLEPGSPHRPEDFEHCGSGRAPDGLCGALHAACVLRPDSADGIRAGFFAEAGAVYCRELKREHGYACESCVTLAVRLLSRHAA